MDVNRCNHILPTKNRQCRNYAKEDGYCQLHSSRCSHSSLNLRGGSESELENFLREQCSEDIREEGIDKSVTEHLSMCQSSPEKLCKSYRRIRNIQKNKKKVNTSAGINATNKLGQGSFGAVYSLSDQPTVVVKILDNGLEASVVREISAFIAMNEVPHILNMFDFLIKKNRTKVYFPKYDSGLDVYLRKKGIPKPDKIKKIMFQIVDGLHNLHNRNIYHRDLKPQNILIQYDTLDVVITDLGLCRFASDVEFPNTSNTANTVSTVSTFPIYMTHEVQSLYYRAPEILLGSRFYNRQIDIWSLGLIFLELFNGSAVITGDSEIDQLFKIFHLIGTPTEQTWTGVSKLSNYHTSLPEYNGNINSMIDSMRMYVDIDSDAEDLILKMLQLDPNKRITIDQIIHHPYFDHMQFSEPTYDSLERIRLMDIYCLQPHLNQKEITDDMREKLVDWIIQKKYKNFETLCLAISIIDAFSQYQEIPESHYYYYGSASFLLANLVHEICIPDTYSLIITPSGATSEEIIYSLSSDIFRILGGDLFRSTEAEYLRYYSKKYKLYDDDVNLAKEIIKKTLKKLEMRMFTPEQIAQGVVAMVLQKTKGISLSDLELDLTALPLLEEIIPKEK